MKNKRKFGSAEKAQIVLSVVKKEATALEIGQRHQIAPGLIYKWRDDFLERAHTVFETNRGEAEKDRKIKHYEHIISKITTQNDFLEKVLAVAR